MRTASEGAAPRTEPRYDKPQNWDELVRVAHEATRAAITAGADYETVKRSAKAAAYQAAGLSPADDPWRNRTDLD